MSEVHGMVWWSELRTRDVEAAKRYYGEICGWTFEEMPMEGSTYVVAFRDGKHIAGIMDMTGMPEFDEMPQHWFTYMAVDDVDAAVAKTTEQGGTITQPPYDVENVGRIVMATDPSGAPIGIMTPAPPPQG